MFCSRHDVAAAFRCERCEQGFCEPCLKTVVVRGVTLHACPDCQGLGRLVRWAPPATTRDFLAALKDVPRYPLRADGWIVLLTGWIFFGSFSFAAEMGSGITAGAVLICGVFLASYYAVFLLSIVRETADGKDVLPDWPDAHAVYLAFAGPILGLVAAVALCVVPAVLLAVALELEGPIVLAAAVLGLMLLPVHLIVLSMGGGLRSLNPLITWPAALRGGTPYLVACGVFLAALVARELVVLALGFVPILGAALGGLVSSYGLAVAMRIVGLVQRLFGERMGLSA